MDLLPLDRLKLDGFSFLTHRHKSRTDPLIFLGKKQKADFPKCQTNPIKSAKIPNYWGKYKMSIR